MTIAPSLRATLGTMVAYGFPGARPRRGARAGPSARRPVLEILPDWRSYPDPRPLLAPVADAGLSIHSAHGCWGGQTIRAPRVDLGSGDPATHRASVDDLKRCLDWLAEAGGRYLVVHPGGLSDPDAGRRSPRLPWRGACSSWPSTPADRACPLRREHAARGPPRQPDGRPLRPRRRAGPPRAGPGPRHRPRPHRRDRRSPRRSPPAVSSGPPTSTTTTAAKTPTSPPASARSTGTRWSEALDAIGYRGPIMLECIRHIRRNPQCLDLPPDDARSAHRSGPSTRRRSRPEAPPDEELVPRIGRCRSGCEQRARCDSADTNSTVDWAGRPARLGGRPRAAIGRQVFGGRSAS